MLRPLGKQQDSMVAGLEVAIVLRSKRGPALLTQTCVAMISEMQAG